MKRYLAIAWLTVVAYVVIFGTCVMFFDMYVHDKGMMALMVMLYVGGPIGIWAISAICED